VKYTNFFFLKLEKKRLQGLTLRTKNIQIDGYNKINYKMNCKKKKSQKINLVFKNERLGVPGAGCFLKTL